VAYEKSHFVSLVGQGASSALVPYLGYLQKFGQPLSVTLLPSPATAQWLPGLEAQIRKLSPDVEVRIREVASGFAKDEVELPEPKDVYRKLEKELGTLAINMMGGMKKCSLGGLLALEGKNHVFLQISDERLIISRLFEGTVHTESMIMETTIPAKLLLDLQRIDYRINESPTRDLRKLCHEGGVRLPPDAVCEAVVGGHRIDCLWSAENNLLHLLLIAPPHFKDSSDALASARRVEALAGSKSWTNGLYSRKIIVLESEPRNVERYTLELAGRVQPYLVEWHEDRLTDSAAKILADIFKPKKPVAPAVIHKPSLDPAPVPTLITSMGKLSDATLLAIAAHARPQLVLLHTPDDEWVSQMIKIYQLKAKALGVRSVLALPTDYTAANVHAHLPEKLARHAEVNVTPGTKAQGTALGLWAKCHGAPAWALGRGAIERIDGVVEQKPVPLISLKTRLDLTLELPITDYGWGASSMGFGDPFYGRMMKLMCMLLDKGREAAFLKDPLALDGYKLSLSGQGGRQHWRFEWPADSYGPAGTRSLKDGYWYERLTAKAVYGLNRLGRESYDVSCGVEVSPPGQGQRFLTERDVLAATSKAQLFMISCKTAGRFKSNVYKRILSEVEAMAKTLGRFVIPILCDMTPNEPKMAGEVMVIGWTTLCRPERLQSALEKAAKSVHG
jgi:hypothetical protein